MSRLTPCALDWFDARRIGHDQKPGHDGGRRLVCYGAYEHRRPYFIVITKPLRSALTIAPTELPVRLSSAPFSLVNTIACPPRPKAAPTFPAA